MKVYGLKLPAGWRFYENKEVAYGEYVGLRRPFPDLMPPKPSTSNSPKVPPNPAERRKANVNS